MNGPESYIAVTAFYKFVEIPVARVEELVLALEEKGVALALRGLVLIAPEGINATVSGVPAAIIQLKQFLRGLPEFSGIEFKDSQCSKYPFRRFAVQHRDEIVTLKNDSINPQINPQNRLSPSAWDEVLKTEHDSIAVIDVRNDYEVEMGKFKGAINPKTKKFSDFPEFVEKAGIPKDKKVLMYCTGGIRCEKAIEEMYRQGYSDVYQLEGGILRYLEERPNSEFEGECFVFDHRVSVDQELKPSTRYGLCPHCGNPADVQIECVQCGQGKKVCVGCLEQPQHRTCSKNCAYHAGLLLQIKRENSPSRRDA